MKSLETMQKIDGKKPNTNPSGDSTLTVIEGQSQPKFRAITSIDGVDTPKVIVTTFAPPK